MKKINLPTFLTLFRMVLVAPLLVFLLCDDLNVRGLAVGCFVIAAVTDFIDGRLARKKHQTTDFGAFLDPLADKMLVNLTFVALVVLELVPVWLFAVILVRDFAVDGIRMMMAKTGETVSASFFGKAKTMVQMFTLTLILGNLIFQNDVLGMIGQVLLYIVLILTVFSGIDYLKNGWKKIFK